MAWFYLTLAGACEMVWPIGFKYTDGFKHHVWLMAITLSFMILSFWLMGLATSKGIPIGTAYAVWTGLGATGSAILGIILFHDPRDAFRLVCLSLIILGVIGLRFQPPPSNQAPISSARVN
jgi:quaternary ammonium compound-resistance protein SugE